MSNTAPSLRNPYTPMSAEDTVDLGNFVGRRELWFTDLNARLRREPGRDRHLLIQGRSGVGKTCLLRQIVRHATSQQGLQMAQNCVHYIDLGEPGLTPLGAVKRILDVIRPRASTGWIDGLSERGRRLADAITLEAPIVGGPAVNIGKVLNDRQPETMTAVWELVHRALNHLVASSTILIVLDQIGVIAEYAEQAQRGGPDDAWRPFLQGLVRLLEVSDRLGGDRRLLFIMGVRMERTGALLAVASDLLFSGAVGRIESLSGLTADEARLLITRPAERQGMTYADATVTLLLQSARYSSFGLLGDVVGTSPLGLQLACWSLWEWQRREGRLVPGSVIDASADHLDAAFASVLGPRLAGFSEDERAVLQTIAEYGALTTAHLVELATAIGVQAPSQVIDDLCKHDLQPVRFVRQSQCYAIAHDLLREYFVKSIPPEQLRLHQAQRLLEDAPRRIHAGSPLSKSELDELWHWRDQLSPTPQRLVAVFVSQALSSLTDTRRWMESFGDIAVSVLTLLIQRPQDEKVRLAAAEQLVDMGERQSVVPALIDLAGTTDDESLLFSAAEGLHKLGELAASVLTDSAARKVVAASVRRGDTHRQKGRYEEALANYSRAIVLDPNPASAISSRGETYRQMGRYEEALADLTHAIALDPNSTLAIGSRGVTYRQMMRYEKALADLTRAIELDPNLALAYGSRGKTYRQMGRNEEALADLTRAIELDPNLDWAYLSRGETYRLMGRYEEALADLNRAIELEPQDDWPFYLRALASWALGDSAAWAHDLAAAQVLARSWRAEHGDTLPELANLALYLLAGGEEAECRQLYARVLTWQTASNCAMQSRICAISRRCARICPWRPRWRRCWPRACVSWRRCPDPGARYRNSVSITSARQ
jgi:tetratricopeptide (TPR) repeat protein